VGLCLMRTFQLRRLLCLAVSLVTVTVVSRVAASLTAEPRVERLDAKYVVVTWTASAPVNVYLSKRPDAGTSEAKLVSEADPDGRHTVMVTESTRCYFLLHDAVDGSVVRVSERILPLERGSNFRDVGGYAAAGGKHVRWGKIYRSGATPLLSDHDIAYIRTLGLGSMIDLRSTEERQLAPTRLTGQGIRYIAIDYPFMRPKNPPSTGTKISTAVSRRYGGKLLTALAPQYRAIFIEMLSRKEPIAYNCGAGQDRTGVGTALILSALGVPREKVLEDYHLSTLHRRPENELPIIDLAKYPDNPVAALLSQARKAKPQPLYSADGRSLLAETFDEIETRWGSVENYLEQVLDVGPAELAILREQYLE